MKKYLILLSAILITIAIATPAFAVPSLQLYITDATYYDVNPWFPDSEDSWITTDNPFELYVAGAITPEWVNYIDNVMLHIALLEDEYLLYKNLTSPFITIEDCEPNPNIDFETITLYAENFLLFGQPDGISPHGIYDTYYASVSLPPLLVATAGETVYDYDKYFDPGNPEASGSDLGDIQYYSISYDPRFTFIHFDATGTAHNGHIKDVFAPYSHDADAIIPEPTTMLLLGSGLLGLAVFGRARRFS